MLHPSRRSRLFPDLSGGRDAHSAAGPDQFEEAWPKVQGIPKDEELACLALDPVRNFEFPLPLGAPMALPDVQVQQKRRR